MADDENAVTVVNPGTEVAPLTSKEIVAHARRIQEVMLALFTDGTHYGRIPGCGDKPTLYKAGAEIIASTFRIAIRPVVTDLSTPDEIRYRVEARATSMATGAYLGSGIGECSTHEAKYRWRAAVSDREFDATPAERKRTRFGKDKEGKQDQHQIRTEPADLANTVLKMAKKRALVDCVLTVTAASDCFAQDIEDMPEDVRQSMSGQENQDPQGKPPISEPRRKSEAAKPEPAPAPAPTPAPSGNIVRGVVDDIQVKSGKKANGQPWTRWGVGIGGTYYGTFSDTVAKVGRDAMDFATPVRLTFEQQGEHRNITDLQMDPGAAKAAPRDSGDEEPPAADWLHL